MPVTYISDRKTSMDVYNYRNNENTGHALLVTFVRSHNRKIFQQSYAWRAEKLNFGNRLKLCPYIIFQ